MLRQIKYFQAVVKYNSFSEAAEECHISQSAISQQVKALEQELGIELLERKNRKFILTAAGEHFYKKSLVLVADYEQICRETVRIAHEDNEGLKAGYLRCYSGQEFHLALEQFAERYPDVPIEVMYGNHEELYHMLKDGIVDFVFNDQRRAFSDEYVNLHYVASQSYIKLSVRNPLAILEQITVSELKNMPCILIASEQQRDIEAEFYANIVGFKGDILFAENMEEARLMVIGGKGVIPSEGTPIEGSLGEGIKRIPLFRGKEQVTRNYCGFWRKDSMNSYAEIFATLLKASFEK